MGGPTPAQGHLSGQMGHCTETRAPDQAGDTRPLCVELSHYVLPL